MNQVWTVELYVYLTTAFCALLLLPRSANWRLRLVIGTVGLQSLAQAVTQLRINHPFWQSRLGTITGIVEMFGGALALTAIYLLKKENTERRSTDARLRLSEADEKIVKNGAPLKSAELAGPTNSTDSTESASTRASNLLALEESVSGSRRSVPETQSRPQNWEPGRENRKSRRFPISMSALVTRLDGEQSSFECKVADISQGGACLSMPVYVPPGGLLKIEYRDFLFLGEVCRCEESEGLFIAGVQFEHRINIAKLSRLLREIGYEAKETRAKARTA